MVGNFPPAVGKKSSLELMRLFDAESVATTQLPTGLGHANAKRIEFGPTISGNEYSLSSTGQLTILETNNYNLKIGLQFARTGASGVSSLWFYIVVGGVQAGKSVNYVFEKSTDEHYFDYETLRYITAGTVIEVFIVRDLNSDNSGGLYRKESSEPLLINASPCASLRVDKFKVL